MARKSLPPESKSAQPLAEANGDLGFLGNHPINLDEKLRLKVPAKLKAVLQRKYGGRSGTTTVVVTISLDRYRNAAVYPLPEWKRYIGQLQRLPVLERHSQQLQRLVTSLASPCELDGQGRIRLDKKVVEVARLEKSVVVVGRGTHFEIWDQRRFDDFVEDTISHADTMSDSAVEQLRAAPAGASQSQT